MGLGAACDTRNGATDQQQGPPLRLRAAAPADGEGLDCAAEDASCGVPLDTDIVLELDRPLLPRTAVRQSLRVYTGTPTNAAPLLSPVYDVINRTLRFRPNGRLRANALYQVELFAAEAATDVGLRAYDGAPLREADVPIAWTFMTSAEVRAAPEPGSPAQAVPDCEQIARLLAAHCASGCCHGGDAPALGLRLDSEDALVKGAIGRVAHQTDIGPTSGTTYENPARFGVGMPIIDRGSAASSYLVYKLLLKPENSAPCVSDCSPFESLAEPAGCVPLSDGERGRLSDWFVQGEAMPLGADARLAACSPPNGGPLDCGSLRALARWIDAGAACD